MEEAATFLSLTVEVLRKTERVVLFYGVAPELRTQVSLAPYVEALSTLCRKQRKCLDGLADLQAIQQLLERQPKRAVTTEEFAEVRKIAERYFSWLRALFPKAHEPLCGHPFRRLFRRVNYRCERCQARDATVHSTILSPSGIERHEFCESCYRQMEPQSNRVFRCNGGDRAQTFQKS